MEANFIEDEQRFRKHDMISKINQEPPGAKASAFPKHFPLPLKPHNKTGRIRKLLEALQKLALEPRYLWQIITGLPGLIIRHVLRGLPILWVRRSSGIGDIICTFPSIIALRQQKKAVIVYETLPGNVPLVSRFRSVDLVIEQGSPFSWLCRTLFKIEQLWSPSLPDEHTPKHHCERIHLREEFRRGFGLASLATEPVHLEITPRATKTVRKWMGRDLRGGAPLVVIHTGPTWKIREWLNERWTELVTRLKSELGVEVIQIGQDSYISDDGCVSPRAMGAVDWVGKLSMDQMLALLKEADLFVGIDSGMLHMAGAVRTACVGIFGPTDPGCRLPIGSPAVGVTAQVPCLGCHHNAEGPGHWITGCPHDIRCMSSLRVEDVFRACADPLNIYLSTRPVTT
jgi:ADP-heptose:LPS heptosyltransferase